MKKIPLLFAVLTLTIGTVLAQKNDKAPDAPLPPAPKVTNIDNDLISGYNRALSYGDYEAAKNFVFQILAKNPGNLAWQDSLVQIYFSIGAYVQCVLAGTELLTHQDTNYAVLEFVAASEYSLKRYRQGLDAYEKLFKHSHSSYHAYQLAINQYMIQRYGECDGSIQFILADMESDKQKILMNLSNGGSQEVPLKAAAWNLRGVIQKDLNKNAEAKACFEQALKLFPDFALAKANVEQLSQPEKKAAPAEKEKPKPAPATPKK